MLIGLYLLSALLCQAVLGIPLPGIDERWDTLPLEDEVEPEIISPFGDVLPGQPDISTNFAFRMAGGVDLHKQGTTESPLAILLDRLYGNDGWKALLDDTTNASERSTSVPRPPETTTTTTATSPWLQGFYSMEISGSAFSKSQDTAFAQTQAQSGSTDTIPQTIVTENAGHTHLQTGISKTLYKTVSENRAQQSTEGIHNMEQSGKEEHVDNAQWNPLTMNPDTPGIFLKEQARADTNKVTMKPPTQQITQSFLVADGGGAHVGTAGVSNGQFNGGGSGQLTHASSYGGTFDPDAVNSQMGMYKPDAAFNNFITQTGSDPTNTQRQTHYDADEINKELSQLSHAPQGVATGNSQAVFGEEAVGYRFSAYESVPGKLFDASALNMALMSNHQQQQQQQQQSAQSMSMTGSSVQQHVNTQTPMPQASVASTNSNTSPRKVYATTKAPPKAPVRYQATSTPTPTKSYDFVPGNLFPGQSSRSQTGDNEHGETSQVSNLPSFLRNVPMTSKAFDPDVVNAAQSVFNPNSVSWIRSRALHFPDIIKPSLMVEDETQNEQTNATSVPKTNSVPIKVNAQVSTILPPTTQTSLSPEATTKLSHSETSNSGGLFNADNVNANQGQSSFVPGQMSSTYSGGAVPGPYIQGQGETSKDVDNNYGMGSIGGGASMNFNIASLLGMNKTATNSSTNAPGIGASAFNPNVMNSVWSKSSNGNTSTVSGFGMGFTGSSGFDPNAANVGFGNALSGGFGFEQSGNSSGFGTGGFDPNSANVGFGSKDYGMGGLAGGSSYMSAFDPNKANGMGGSNPSQTTPDNSSSISSNGIMAYFLGAMSGKGNSHSGYASAYISAFNPDTVNQVSYNPDNFNQGHLHFTPVDMLSSNPGIDKDALTAAASAFDPNKLNNEFAQLAFSPVDMLAHIPGIDNDKTSTSKTNQSGQGGYTSSTNAFDPVNIMKQLMQSVGAFNPGLANLQHQSFNPNAMFQNGGTQQQKQTTSTQAPSSTSGVNSSTAVSVPGSTPTPGTSSTKSTNHVSPIDSTTPAAATTRMSTSKESTTSPPNSSTVV